MPPLSNVGTVVVFNVVFLHALTLYSRAFDDAVPAHVLALYLVFKLFRPRPDGGWAEVAATCPPAMRGWC